MKSLIVNKYLVYHTLFSRKNPPILKHFSSDFRAQRRWRKAVTGDPDKRIRDHMKETPQVKMLDKFSFTLGVIVICLSEWLILRQPNLFPYFYYAIMAVLMAYRYYDYASQKAELFMLDFCYFVNLSVMLQTAFYPDNLMWFKANYVLCMGPICIAIMVWKNSLVFHSLDKLTSFFLHAFPTMTCHLFRWRIVDHDMKFKDPYIGFEAHFLYPFGLYLAWQIWYLVMTEIVLKSRLDADQEIITSQRYFSDFSIKYVNLNRFSQKNREIPRATFSSFSIPKHLDAISRFFYF